MSLEALSLTGPLPVLDPWRAQANIAAMAAKADRHELLLRPHFKTHQSAEIGGWFREAGVTAITVSSTGMAAYFAEAGWRDITLALPVHAGMLPALRELAGSVRLGLLVDSPAAVQALVSGLKSPASVWIKVDAGYGRAGIRWDRADRVAALAWEIDHASQLEFAGILAHNGHSYRAGGPEGVRAVHKEALGRLASVRAQVAAVLGRCPVSIGDTPSCRLAENFEGVDEIRPGNFVFHDLQQRSLGVCADGEIALALACPVIGLYPERGQALVHGGAIHFSKDFLVDAKGQPVHGYLAAGGGLGPVDESAALRWLSQEHGLLHFDDPGRVERLILGESLLIYPAHSCLAADLHGQYLSPEGRIIPKWGGDR